MECATSRCDDSAQSKPDRHRGGGLTGSHTAAQLHVRRIVLIAKPHLIELFIKAGFAVNGLSPAMGDQGSWLQLVLDCEAARQIPIVQVRSIAQSNRISLLFL